MNKTEAGKTSSPFSQRIDEAKSDGNIDDNAFSAFVTLDRIVNFTMYFPLLRYRLAATAMICNRLGVLAGISGTSGTALAEVRYRKQKITDGIPTQNLTTSMQALQAEANLMVAPPDYGDSQLFSTMQSSYYNPTPIFAEPEVYRNYDGPPLAPRRRESRVITNYVVQADNSHDQVSLECGWDDIYGITPYGTQEAFMNSHFEGTDRQKKRDLRGGTDYDKQQFERQIRAWMTHLATGNTND